MTSTANYASTATIDALARCRYTILTRASALLNDDGTTRNPQEPDAVRGLSGLLMTSLEELKLAEQELRAQNATLAAQRAGIDERTRHYHTLFLHTPAPAVITDSAGAIREANLAAARLFRRDANLLEQTTLGALLPREDRDEFRKRLKRFAEFDGVCDWRLTISRLGDVPMGVHAAVQHVPGLGPSASGVLYWLFSPPDGPEAWSQP